MGLDTDDNAVQDDAKSVTTDTNIRPVVIQQPQTIQQQPFQPGSTPVHLMHRFMVSLQAVASFTVSPLFQPLFFSSGLE